MSINSGARGWLNILLFAVDGVFVNILNGYMALFLLLLDTSRIDVAGGGIPIPRLDIIIDK